MLRLVGWKVQPVTPEAGDCHAAGFVAHAVLSDGTLSWPMGARVRATEAEATLDGPNIKMSNSGPFISTRQRIIRPVKLNSETSTVLDGPGIAHCRDQWAANDRARLLAANTGKAHMVYRDDAAPLNGWGSPRYVVQEEGGETGKGWALSATIYPDDTIESA